MTTQRTSRLTRRWLSLFGELWKGSHHVPGAVSTRSMGILMLAAALPLTFRSVPESEAMELEPVSAELPPSDVRPDLSPEASARVEYWVNRFITDQRPTFELFLVQEGLFGDLIRSKLSERGMPEDLLHLAMIESGLRPRAVSRVEAVGVWQFMGPTAAALGLRVDDWVDERRDPIKATDAALDFLGWLYDQYGSWTLAAAAYNAGPSRVNRILSEANLKGAEGDDIYWAIRHRLPVETQEYVPRWLAATEVIEHHYQEFVTVQRKSPYMFERVWVPGGTALRTVADRLGVDRDLVWALNPHLIKGVTPPGETYPLRVPTGAAFQVVASLGRHPWSRRSTDD